MRSIQTIVDEREPGQVQVFGTGVDASVASLGGISQAATLWLPLELARQVHRDLLGRLTTARQSSGSSPTRCSPARRRAGCGVPARPSHTPG
jgi:hypothetical protein